MYALGVRRRVSPLQMVVQQEICQDLRNWLVCPLYVGAIHESPYDLGCTKRENA